MNECRQSELENGVRVLTERIETCRSLSLCVMVDAGPYHETTGKEGLAHLTEHMVFQGTSNRTARQIAQLMDLAGGQIGGFTTRDYTCYQATVLDEHGTYAVDLLGDLLLNSTFDARSLENEKAAILREIDSNRDIPERRVHELLRRRIWGEHPLGRPLGGDRISLEGLTREDVIYFLHENYLPNRILIAAAGNLDHDDLTAQVRDAFWRMLGRGEVGPEQAMMQQGGMSLEAMPLGSVYFSLGIPTVAYASAGRYLVHLFSNILGGGLSSRFHQLLREESGLVYHIGTEYLAYREAGLLVIEGSTSPENFVVVLRAILRELMMILLGRSPITEDEIWKAKTQLRRQHLLAGEQPSTRMSRLANQAFYLARPIPAEEILRLIEGVRLEQMHALLDDWLPGALANLAVAAVGPGVEGTETRAVLADLLSDFE